MSRYARGQVSPFVEESPGYHPVVGFLHRPDGPSVGSIVLTHGAGSNCEAPLLVVVARAFCEGGFNVLRCDLPFRQTRPHGPPVPALAAFDREGLRRAVEVVRALYPGKMFLGGHSYGGRQASMLAAAAPGLVSALLLLSYPLRPPRRVAEPRTAHFAKLDTPALFVHGTRDPFGSLEEMRSTITSITVPTELLAIESAGHGLFATAEVAWSIFSGFRKFAGGLGIIPEATGISSR